uniref:DUF488 domain-containing protein n=1 Tax=Fervidicoccus fontis TaxID=683846 RepID=A0A7J3ZKI1_9CREN
MKTVYTVGYNGRTLEEFLELLAQFSITLLIDVRRWPTSRRMPWFSREALQRALERLGIEYLWLGDLLGGYRHGGFEQYMKSREYGLGIERLVNAIESSRGFTAVMCCEKLWFRCHRRFISDSLVDRGYVVVHIIEEGKTYIHKRKL